MSKLLVALSLVAFGFAAEANAAEASSLYVIKSINI